jgi:hypothetical protein
MQPHVATLGTGHRNILNHATTPRDWINSVLVFEFSQIMYLIMTVFHQKYKAKNPTLFRLTDVFDSTTIGTLGLEKRNGV